jgi:hypothetical protein
MALCARGYVLGQISDTPTSRVASAAQGYVELEGRGDHIAGAQLLSKTKRLPCLWYRYEISQKTSDDKWSHVEDGESDDPFLLIDATGSCVIDPEAAEIVTTRRETWTEGSYRYTEWLLLGKDPLYVIGEFATIGGPNSELDAEADVRELLTAWKNDQPQLLERFDVNKDGKLDLKEWELARRQAQREVETHHREARMRDGTHLMRCPSDGRLFLISNYPPDRLRRRYLRWAWGHIFVFFGAGAGAFALF